MSSRTTNRLLAFIACGGMLSAAFLSSPPGERHPRPGRRVSRGARVRWYHLRVSVAGHHRRAYSVCSSREAGFTEMEIVAKVLQGNDLSDYQAGFLVGAAEAAYCPAQAGNGYGAVKS